MAAKIESKEMKSYVIHDTLPPEIIVKIFELLNFKDICEARIVCTRWKQIIDENNLVFGKIFELSHVSK